MTKEGEGSDSLAYQAVKAVVRKYEEMPAVTALEKRRRKIAIEVSRECEEAVARAISMKRLEP